MRILFSMRHLGSLRMYDSVLRRLATAGHHIDILARRKDVPGTNVAPETLLAGVPNIHWVWEEVEIRTWTEIAAAIRIWLDYLRFCAPQYRQSPRARRHVGERVPALLRRVSAWPLVRGEAGRRTLVACLRLVERVLPRQPGLDALVRELSPDVVLLTPVLRLGSSQVEVLRSARAFGARTAICVASWDHLSSKARIAEMPDKVFVWNGTQKTEATTLHAVAESQVVVTGAQCYDQWFDRGPGRPREVFCDKLGLPADRPFLLYACSALSPEAPTEARFIQRWIESLRASDDPVLRTAGVLVRPHPQRLAEWREVDLSHLPDVTVYGSHPLDTQSKEDYFDSLYHSSAVVGLLTSVFLEASILGKPVHTLVLPEFVERQSSLFHFPYLLSVGGGLLRAAHSFPEHEAQLAASLREPVRPDLNATFVQAFIRPAGLDVPATDVFVSAVEAFGAEPRPEPAREPLWAPLVRGLVWPVAALTHRSMGRSQNPTDRTTVELQQARRRDERRREKEAAEQQRQQAREAERQLKQARADQARQAELRERDQRIASDRRQKDAHRIEKERERGRRQRAKWRAALLERIKRRVGWGAAR
jgi:hypothetical protein